MALIGTGLNLGDPRIVFRRHQPWSKIKAGDVVSDSAYRTVPGRIIRCCTKIFSQWHQFHCRRYRYSTKDYYALEDVLIPIKE